MHAIHKHAGKGIGGARSSVDASVVVKVGDTKSETKIVKGTLNPSWNEEVSVPIEDSSEFIEMSLYHNGLVNRTFLGYEYVNVCICV